MTTLQRAALSLALAPLLGCMGQRGPIDSERLDTGAAEEEPCREPASSGARARALQACTDGAYAAVLEGGAGHASVQDAIDAAGGQVVFVCPGTHIEHLDTAGSALVLASASGDPSDTTLSGDDRGQVLTATGDAVSVYNLTFTAGEAHEYGGGISSDDDVELRCATFTDNLSRYAGGAVYTEGALEVVGCHFEDNVAHYVGGALNPRGPVTVSDSTFSGNTAAYAGGAISTYDTASISGSTFDDNSADHSGGALMLRGVSAVRDSTFTGNHADYAGGGIEAAEDLALTNNVFDGNECDRLGGAVSWRDRDPHTLTITGDQYLNNVSRMEGGALALGSWGEGDQVFIDGSTFEANSSINSGGTIEMATWGYIDLWVTNSSFYDNTTRGEGGVFELGGRSTGTQIDLNGVILDGNQARNGAVLYADTGLVDVWLSVTDSTLSGNMSDDGVVLGNSNTDTSSTNTDWTSPSSTNDNSAADFEGPCGTYADLGAAETFTCSRDGTFTR